MIRLDGMEVPRLRASGEWFTDGGGRVAILRGVNLGGDCKVPYSPDGSTHLPTDFSGHENVSFIGRPFPLEQADEHFSRLRSWGFNVLRLLTTWEAIEHAGPGEFDTGYLDYYTELCKMAGEHGMYVFVDMHQDVWSRMTGGDGAPCWLFGKVGIDYTKLSKAGAALVMQHAFDFKDPRPRQPDNYPMMSWSQNYRYAGNAIMWTLFFGGRDFAPDFRIDGMNVQDYMQGHYLACQRAIGQRVKGLTNVLGFDSLNEPSAGWIGAPMDDRHLRAKPGDPAMPGIAWSAIDALLASNGYPVTLPYLALKLVKLSIVPVRDVLVNPDRISIFFPGRVDPFQEAGAWQLGAGGTATVVHNDYFQRAGGRAIEFTRDNMMPFIRKVADNVQSINPEWAVFAEKDAKETAFNESFPTEGPNNFVNASHWYDNAINGTKKVRKLTLDVVAMRPAFGARGIQAMYTRQLARIKAASTRVNGGSPTLVGEFGIPMDLDDGRSFRRHAGGNRGRGLWKAQEWALGLMYNALDALLLSGTLWNYAASNRNDPRIGDGWNQEDLSVYSIDQRDDPSDINSGGRAIHGFVRPYPRFVQGIPKRVEFNSKSGVFSLAYEADPTIPGPTVVYVPRIQYPGGFEAEACGQSVVRDDANQTVAVAATRHGEHTVVVRRKGKK